MASCLPDPRCYGFIAGDTALAAFCRRASTGDEVGAAELHSQVRLLLEAGDDAALHAALRAAPSRATYCSLWSAICAVAEDHEAGSDTAIVARPFAIPVVCVAGARRLLRIPGALPDVAEIHALFDREGAVGPTRNFGLSAELISVETLEAIRPSSVFRWNHTYTGGAMDGMPGAAIEVAPGREQAHLRFVLGAGITPAHLPSFLETAADIGRWGTAFTQTLARQLAQTGLEVLPLARPPAGLLAARHAGRRAAIETAFQLFASHSVRTCRMTAGEPVVIVSAHRAPETSEVRVSVSSMLDDTLLEGFRWPLHPLDEFETIVSSIADLLDACRVADVRWVPEVLAHAPAAPATMFIRVRDFERVAEDSRSH